MPDYPAISFGMLTPLSFVDFRNAERLFDSWLEHAPSAFPDRFGDRDPARYPFEKLNKYWKGFSLHFSRIEPPLLEATISIEDSYGLSHCHSGLCAYVDSVDVVDQHLGAFISAACRDLQGHFGYVHRVNDTEAKMGLETNTTSRYLLNGAFRSLSIFSHQLKLGTPNLFWITILGKPYVEAFGRDVINSCPCETVEWLSDDMVLLQLTDSVHDSFEHEEEFERIRLRAKEHLGLKYFQPYCRREGGVMIEFDSNAL